MNKTINKVEDLVISKQKPTRQSYGIRNGQRVYDGYNDERKVINRKHKAIKRGKYYYAKNAYSDKTVNRIPSNLTDKIVCGDSLIILQSLPDNCVDVIFTSPPYNFGLDYSVAADDIDWDSYFDTLFLIFDQCCRVLKRGGRLIVNVQPLFSDYIPSHHLISHHLIMKRKMIWKGEILWEKNNYNCKYTAWGSWQSPSSPYLKYTWEFLEIFCKGDLKKSGSTNNIDISKEEFKQWVNAKWSIAPERNMKKYQHPAMFPEALVNRVLKLFSFKGDFVLDPFNGVGTTTRVCKKLSRHYLGIDISKSYCQIAMDRLGNTPAQLL